MVTLHNLEIQAIIYNEFVVTRTFRIWTRPTYFRLLFNLLLIRSSTARGSGTSILLRWSLQKLTSHDLPTCQESLAIYLLRNEGRGGGGFPYMGYMSMCHGIGLTVFEVLIPYKGYHFCPVCIVFPVWSLDRLYKLYQIKLQCVNDQLNG